jgi:hypothetical protein
MVNNKEDDDGWVEESLHGSVVRRWNWKRWTIWRLAGQNYTVHQFGYPNQLGEATSFIQAKAMAAVLESAVDGSLLTQMSELQRKANNWDRAVADGFTTV